MSYFKPYIDDSGYHYPTYNEILEELVTDMQDIFGSGIYLGNDSQDYQLLSRIAEKIYDTYQVCEIVYNSHSPATAIGTGLDYIVAINGIARKQATRSTVSVEIRGTAGTTIENGMIADENGFFWELPPIVIIGDNGMVEVDATCRDAGLAQAEPGTVNRIMTPTMGWESVSNSGAAVTGTVIETDAELRARQAESVAQPSQSMKQGLQGALSALADVSRCYVYENDTSITDENGVPSHSVCCIVEGGDDEEIARTILFRKGCGCGTHGTTEITVQDDDEQDYKIKFSRPRQVDVDIEIEISRRPGYTEATPTEITGAVAEYLNTFSIGTDLTTSIIWMVAQQINADYRAPAFSVTSIKAARHGGELGVGDIVIAYDEVARGNATYIKVNVR